MIARFSEDVDLAIAGTAGWTGGQIKKLMDQAARHLTRGLVADPTAARTVRGSHFRKTAHRFPTVHDPTGLLPQLRARAVLVEINAFARPSPSHLRPVQSYIGQVLAQSSQALERTLVEKILALVRAGYAPDPLAEW